MISLLCSLGRLSLALLAALIVGLLPSTVRAEAIAIKNSAPATVRVEPACQVRNQVRPARPFLLKAGDTSPGIVLPGNKFITIRDASNHILGQIVIEAGTEDQTYEIVMGTGPTGKPTWTINKVTAPKKDP